jgi:hypothetical protein
LDTHDVAISIPTRDQAEAINGHKARQLRCLLLSPTEVAESKLLATIQRIHHFASLTGGEDLAIVFLLHEPKLSTFVSAKDVTNASHTDNETSAAGIYAFTTLQSTMFARTEIPHIPILPFASLDALPALLRKHATALSRPTMSVPLPITSSELLKMCTTADQPMDQTTVSVVAELVPDLRSFARLCSSSANHCGSSSPSVRSARSLQTSADRLAWGARIDHARMSQDDAQSDDVQMMRKLLGGDACKSMSDFWAEEFTVE